MDVETPRLCKSMLAIRPEPPDSRKHQNDDFVAGGRSDGNARYTGYYPQAEGGASRCAELGIRALYPTHVHCRDVQYAPADSDRRCYLVPIAVGIEAVPL